MAPADTSECPADWSDTEGIFDDRIVVGSHGMWSSGLDHYAGFAAHLEAVNRAGGLDGRDLVFETRFLAPNDGGMFLRSLGALLGDARPFVVSSVGATNSVAEIQRLVEERCVPDLLAHGVDHLPPSEIGSWTLPGLHHDVVEAALWADAVLAISPSPRRVALVRDEHLPFESQAVVFAARLRELVPDVAVEVVTHGYRSDEIDVPDDVDVVVALTSGDFCHLVAAAAAPRPTLAPGHCLDRWWPPAAGAAPGVRGYRINFAGAVDPEMRRGAAAAAGSDTQLEAGVPMSFRRGWVHAAVVVEILTRASQQPEGLTRSGVAGVARSLVIDHPAIDGATVGPHDGVGVTQHGVLERWDRERSEWVPERLLQSDVDPGDIVDHLAGRADTCPPRPAGVEVATSGWRGTVPSLDAASRPLFVLDGLRWPATAPLDGRFWVQVKSGDGQFQSTQADGRWDPDCPGRVLIPTPPWFDADVASRPGPYDITLRMSAADTLDTIGVRWPDDFPDLSGEATLDLEWVTTMGAVG